MDKATILTEEQIELLVDNVHLVLGQEMVDQMKTPESISEKYSG